MKTIFLGIIATVMMLGLVPFALIARSRASQSESLPPHLVLDMDKQPRFKAQRATPMFADDRAMRPEVANTLAREDLWVPGETINDIHGTRQFGADAMINDPTTYAAVMLGRIRPAGISDDDFTKIAQPNKTEAEIQADSTFYVRKVPSVFAVNEDFVKRGQERFNIYCAPCHGESGFGDGPVALRAADLQKLPDQVSGWASPQNFHEDKIVKRPDGHLFNTITRGIRNMPAYDKQISVSDRWAIITYIRALEHSQNATPPVASK